MFYEGKTINLIEYYKEAHDITIKVADQPLIVVINDDQEIYFIPELCYLGGLDDKAVKDGKFMRELVNEFGVDYDDYDSEIKDSLYCKLEDGNMYILYDILIKSAGSDEYDYVRVLKKL